ncbi:MAG: M56 family metallopeptidase [Clostridia bacterium]|nr:M56 family metallopeptidase [Clostridia bacterium]
MIVEAFYWVLSMSAVASLTGAVVLALRRIKHIPRRLFAVLWAIPFLRMAVPIGLNSRWSLLALPGRLLARTVEVFRVTEDVRFSMMNMTRAADRYFPLSFPTLLLEDIFFAAAFIWFLGALAFLAAFTVVYVSTLRSFRGAAPLQENVCVSPKAQTPAVYGIFRPRIILPPDVPERDLPFILLHERAHVRRGDNLWRLLTLALCAVHWFNPFCWFMLRRFLSDLELACDETAVKALQPEERKEYARALLNCASGKTLFASAFGGAKVRARVENVLSYRKMTILSLAASLLLIGALLFGLLTNAG